MKRKNRILALLTAALLAAGLLAGCGGAASTPAGDTPPAEDAAEVNATEDGDTAEAEADPNKPFAGTVLTIGVSDTAAGGVEVPAMVDLVYERTGIVLEYEIIPNTNDGELDKTLVMLQSGVELDLVYGTTALLKLYYNAGVLNPVDDLAANVGYDFNAVFADGSLPTYEDGKTYGLPAFSDIWLTFINTKWFDEAGIDVPTADGWTWEKYEETAKAINAAGLTTETGMPVWGSAMEAYNCTNYMLATQKGWSAYKADGSANFDDPLFEESLVWYNGLGMDGVQPSKIDLLGGVYAWNQFVASDDYAMYVCGGWVTSMLNQPENYPRDWECAILPMPYPEGEQPSTLTIPGCYAIPTTSTNPEAAFEALRVIAEDLYTLGTGRIPARKNLTDAEISDFIQNQLLTDTFALDPNITEDDIRAGWFDPDRVFLPEKIIGTADSLINDMIKAEADLYGTGSQSLEVTLENIQNKANDMIENADNAA